MSDVAIRVENLSKRYRRGVPAGNDRLSEVAVNLSRLAWSLPRRLAGRFRAPPTGEPGRPDRADEFWALKDVSFEVKRGEVVGVIGRNGAGKSTLLKVLSRITEPTSGRFGVRGRVASLLEVGTGFHGELTGRENVYLSGSLLGMSRAEIAKKFDEIVAFAEVDGFLDTPVKRYSSGMLMRLAFAVAAHLESEILIVDEVLAVGDAQFQKKCLGKMGEVAKGGRTVLFVSHNVTAVRTLCSRAVLLTRGAITEDGPTSRVLPRYLDAQREQVIGSVNLADRLNRTSGDATFEEIRASGSNGKTRWVFTEGEDIRILLSCRVNKPVPGLGAYLAIKSAAGDIITNSKQTVAVRGPLAAGDRAQISLDLPGIRLRPGDYRLYVCIMEPNCTQSYDVIDENVGLPWLVIQATSEDPHLSAGYVTLPGTWAAHATS